MNNNITNNSIIRFITCGSVDDGKSTLIGRLLLDSKSIYDDQYIEIKSASEKKGITHLDLSLLTDGLKAEREQGITIDVAYRYFSTPKRKFIIADTPGHKEFTRNMVTGASTASIALLLIDSRKGISEQTMRHAYINAMLRIPHLIVCFNKMDLCNFSNEVYLSLKKDFQEKISTHLQFDKINFIPVSALWGDNIIERSSNMPWYDEEPLLKVLEESGQTAPNPKQSFRFVFQHSFYNENKTIGVAGRVIGGNIEQGEHVKTLPHGKSTLIEKIEVKGETSKKANAGQSITLFLKSETPLEKGNILVKENDQNAKLADQVQSCLCWLSDFPLKPGKKYILQSLQQKIRCEVNEIFSKVDINTYGNLENKNCLQANDIGTVRIIPESGILADKYSENKLAGSFILIDEQTNETVAGGIII